MSCSKRLMRAARMGGAAAIIIAGLSAGTASAQQPADDSWMLDRQIYDQFLKALGLKKSGDNINYRERSPLVVPPNTELPVPERAAVARHPDWPTDPEIRQKREQDRQETGRSASTDWEESARPLRPDEIARGRNDRRTTASRPAPKTDATGGVGGDPVSPDKLGYVGGLFNSLWSTVGPQKDEYASFTGEPGRSNLTAPPPGYQTPSPSAPYGLSKTKEKPKPKNFMLEHPTAQ